MSLLDGKLNSCNVDCCKGKKSLAYKYQLLFKSIDEEALAGEKKYGTEEEQAIDVISKHFSNNYFLSIIVKYLFRYNRLSNPRDLVKIGHYTAMLLERNHTNYKLKEVK